MNQAPHYFRISVSLKGEILQQTTLPVGEVIIGRGSDCHVVLDNPGISRMHAKLEFIDGQIEVTDLESGNGTFINGNAIRRSVLSPTDALRLGKFSVRVQLTDATDAAEVQQHPIGDLTALKNDSNKTVFLRPEERKQILKQSSGAAKASMKTPIPRTPAAPKKDNSWIIFAAGVMVGVILCGVVSWL